MYGLAQALNDAPMSQRDRDDLRGQMMDAAGNKYRTASQRSGDMFQAMGTTLAKKVQDRGLRRSLLDAMSAYDTANMRGMTRSQRQQMMGAVDMTLPQPVSPAQLAQPFNQTLFGQPFRYDWRYMSKVPQQQQYPWGSYGYDEGYDYGY